MGTEDYKFSKKSDVGYTTFYSHDGINWSVFFQTNARLLGVARRFVA